MVVITVSTLQPVPAASLSPGHLNWLLEVVCAGTGPAPASGHLLSADRVTATRRSGVLEDDTQHWVFYTVPQNYLKMPLRHWITF